MKNARDQRDEARKQVAAGIDPSVARQQAKIEKFKNAAHTIELIGREWFARRILLSN